MNIEWKKEEKPLNYKLALHKMTEIAAKVAQNQENEKIWLLEHEDVYTMGTSSKPHDLLNQNIPVEITSRGGQITYHGIGQRIVYPIINIRKHMENIDIRKYVQAVENWVIRTLQEFGIIGEIKEGRVGVWVSTPNRYFPHFEAKIAAIGIRVSKGVAYHGFAVNINPDLSKFKNIVPCGLPDYGVTSFKDLGVNITMQDFDEALYKHYNQFLKDISL
ncbi:MAG: lipoyl(octanoyl) transferase LipB [Alphaproteobacteria bacterium]|nr:lipoyl(octanoyl) transferase LipB [Alphaproteobacteria bacterium]OJV13566.1 MAG: hypothetical protein BGO27_03005 [Alphaproteobacteria bacterium 33-17]